jgi:lipopolysaccharide export system protein LptA
MWTPKRIILLVGWSTFFICFYFGSSFLLGGIDGLPPLPDRFKPIPFPGAINKGPRTTEPRANNRLRLAFGDNSQEVKQRKFKLEVEPRGLVVAAEEVTIESDGRVKFVPFSVAVFSKEKPGEKGENSFPDITTVQADVAYLTFDKPLRSITDWGSRKITGGELVCDTNKKNTIKISNNRGTRDISDDVYLETTGTLYYDEARHHVWTKEQVRILDLRSKPRPTTIDGTGADLYLLAEQPGDAAATHKPKNQTVSGVDRVELRSNVRMNLWVDAHSGLLGPAHEDPKKGPGKQVVAAAPPAKTAADKEESAKVLIETDGPFVYDFKSDQAIFNISKIEGPRPNLVTVDRYDEKTKMSDQLKCDLLEIQFSRRTGAAATKASSATDKLEIESVRATGKQVVLTSDAEVLEAHGNEFTYNSKTLTSVLKGQPFMDAMKDGNHICAPELQMVNIKGKEQATANGEGTMNFMGTAGAKKLQEARWKKRLTYVKEGDKALLTLDGDAVFLDPDHEQELRGQTLKVQLAPPEADKAVAADATQKRPTPVQVEAIGNVTARSPDLNMAASQRLVLVFEDVKPGVLPPPGGANQAKVGLPGARPAEAAPNQRGEANGANNGSQPAAAAEAEKKSRPIDLKATIVRAHVLREAQRHELQDVYCQGNVRVLQAPEKAGENGVDIRGETLNLVHSVEGDKLTVTGNSAQVQMDQLFILGPEINMDQSRNEVDVKGMGVMRMLSKQSFDGTALATPTELRIEWASRMFFDGTQASFFRDVRATQDTGRMSCEQLEVTLDKHVSLKEGAKGQQPAVEKLVCNNNVGVEDTKREGTKITEFKRISAQELIMDNDNQTKERTVRASGQGSVRMFQLTSKQDGFDSPPKPAAAKQPAKTPNKTTAADDKEFKLTMIWYEGRMWANNAKGIVKFYDHVYLVQLPTEDPKLVIGNGNLPPGAMTLQCDRMELLEEKHGDKTTSQELRAYDKVRVEGQNYTATCDVLKYDTSKEQIILEAAIPGTYAKLFHWKYAGAKPDMTEARKIIYNRVTGNFQAEGMRSSTVSQ